MPPYVPLHDRAPYYASLPMPTHPREGTRTPRYASPDFDPSADLSGQRHNGMSSSTGSEDEQYEEVQQVDIAGATGGTGSYVPRQRAGEGEQAAGPSRKRARGEEEPGRAYENGQGHGQSYGQQPQQAHLTGSIFNISPRNPFTSVVGDFILAHASGLNNVEIEIKLGTLMTPTDHSGLQAPRRIRMPTQSEMIVPPDYPLGPFQSTMTNRQHRVLNNLLNQAAQTSQHLSSAQGKVHFYRSKLTDSFHGQGGRTGRVRVSRDRETGRIVDGGIIAKRRVADMNVYCPQSPFDWRISVNVEEPSEMPNGPATMTRDKDRACYRHQVCQVDLTSVMSRPSDDLSSKPTTSFEIEIEVLDVPTLVAEGQAGSDRFDEILQNVLDTARMLVKNSEPA